MSEPEGAVTTTATLRVPQDHPALPGHFPGRPIVPGVLLLDAVLQALRDAGMGPATRVVRAKFVAPVLPGTEVEIALSPRDNVAGRFSFTCRVEGKVVVLGEIACETLPRPLP